jgi:hypothetical protein
MVKYIPGSSKKKITLENARKRKLSETYEDTCKDLQWPVKKYLFFNSDVMLSYNIDQLPNNLKYRIYIKCMRKFWRNYVPLTAKIPTWYYHAVEQQNMLLMAIQLNIHFMHLPCNTLEKNKKYIIGCQCESCLESKDRRRELIKQDRRPNYHLKKQSFTYSKWNDRTEDFFPQIDGVVVEGLSIFDPDIDLYDNLEDKINGHPIEFNEIDYSLFT